MSEILLQPAGPGEPARHFRDTIETLVPLERIKRFVGADAAYTTLKGTGQDRIAVWGITPGEGDKKFKIWQRIKPGMVAAFTGEGRLYCTGIIVATVHSPDLARDLWGEDKKGQTWEYAYFLTDIRKHALVYTDMNRIVGYKENFVPQGSNIMAEEKASPLLDALAIETTGVSDSSSPTEPPSFDGDLDRASVTKSRNEQSKLRDYLLSQESTPECTLCGRFLPPELLVAAHIKKRAACSDTERRDFGDVATLVCHLGCDRLYENGFVTIGRDGRMEISKRLKEIAQHESGVTADIQRLENRRVTWWNPERDKYCEWHRENVFQHGYE